MWAGRQGHVEVKGPLVEVVPLPLGTELRLPDLVTGTTSLALQTHCKGFMAVLSVSATHVCCPFAYVLVIILTNYPTLTDIHVL